MQARMPLATFMSPDENAEIGLLHEMSDVGLRCAEQ